MIRLPATIIVAAVLVPIFAALWLVGAMVALLWWGWDVAVWIEDEP